MKNKTVENKNTKDKKDSFFKNLVTSIKDFDKYINFVGEGFKKSFIYLVKLISIFSLIVGIISVYDYSKKLNTIEKAIDEKISNMSYENNIMSINNNEKTEIDTIEDLVGRIIIDTSDLTDEQIENYKEELKSQKKSILLLKDKMILKYQTKQELGEQKYSDLLKNEAVSINKDSLVKYYKDNLANIYVYVGLSSFSAMFITYILSSLEYCLLLTIIAYIVALLIKIKMKFAAAFAVAAHAITLPTILNMLYIIVNAFTGFTIKYFRIMYMAVSCIYTIAAIFMIKSDFIKQQMDLQAIRSEQEKVREELKEREHERKEQEEKERAKKEPKDKKEKHPETPDVERNPEGNNA